MSVKAQLMRFCLALILLISLTPTANAQAAWYKLTGPDGDFAVEFPGAPVNELVPVSGTGESLQTHHFTYGNHRLDFNYRDLRSPAATKSQVDAHLTAYARDFTRVMVEKGGQVFRRSVLLDGGVEFVSKYPAGSLRETVYEQSRVYVRGSRLYVISCTSLSDSGVDQAFAMRFFSSLRLYGLLKVRGGSTGNAGMSGAAARARKAVETQWYKFTGPDRDFVAEFPAKPHYDTKAHPVTGAEMQFVSFNYGGYDMSVYSLAIVALPASPAERGQWFAGAAEKFLRGSESTLIRQTLLVDGALQIESRRQLHGRTLFIRARLYSRGARAYGVTCSVYGRDISELDEPVPARFFASFRLE